EVEIVLLLAAAPVHVLVVVVVLDPAGTVPAVALPQPLSVAGHLDPVDDPTDEQDQSEAHHYQANCHRDRRVTELPSDQIEYQGQRQGRKLADCPNESHWLAESFPVRPPAPVLELPLERAAQLEHHDQVPNRGSNPDHDPEERNDSTQMQQVEPD